METLGSLKLVLFSSLLVVVVFFIFVFRWDGGGGGGGGGGGEGREFYSHPINNLRKG